MEHQHHQQRGGGGHHHGGAAHHGHQPEQQLPADALAARAILRSMGAAEAEPRVVAMLLDFMYKYVADVLKDAEAYGEALGRPPGTVELPELSYALGARGPHTFAQPPAPELLQRVADAVNGVDLPEFPLRHGLRVPVSDDDLLVKPNWTFGPAAAGGGGAGAGAGVDGAAAAADGEGAAAAAAAAGGGAAPMDVS